jgi:hypothetical protein
MLKHKCTRTRLENQLLFMLGLWFLLGLFPPQCPRLMLSDNHYVTCFSQSQVSDVVTHRK